MAEWRYELLAIGGQPLALLRPRARGLTLDLAGAGGAKYAMSITEAEVLAGVMQPGVVDLLVSEDGEPRFRGPLTGVQGSGLTPKAGSLSFAATGIDELLDDRYVSAGSEILAMEQTSMAWQLIADTQGLPNGDLGILRGATPASVARSKVWDSATPVRSAIRELAGLDGGFDWSIEPNADGRYTFDAYYPRRGSATAVVLDSRNIAECSPTWDASAGALCNYAAVTGRDGVTVVATDPPSEILYRLRQRVIVLPDADDATILGDRADAEIHDSVVRASGSLVLLPGAESANLTELGLGDVVEVDYRAGWATFSGLYRILRIEVAIPDGGGRETLTVTVEPFG